MLIIRRFAVENLTDGCVTDVARPRFSFAMDSDRKNVKLQKAVLQVGGWKTDTTNQIGSCYDGPNLMPFTRYTATVTATDDAGETAQAELAFETGRMEHPWEAKWISDPPIPLRKKRCPLCP